MLLISLSPKLKCYTLLGYLVCSHFANVEKQNEQWALSLDLISYADNPDKKERTENAKAASAVSVPMLPIFKLLP